MVLLQEEHEDVVIRMRDMKHGKEAIMSPTTKNLLKNETATLKKKNG